MTKRYVFYFSCRYMKALLCVLVLFLPFVMSVQAKSCNAIKIDLPESNNITATQISARFAFTLRDGTVGNYYSLPVVSADQQQIAICIDSLPLISNKTIGILEVVAHWALPYSIPIELEMVGGKLTAMPSQIFYNAERYNPENTMLFLVPLMVGLIFGLFQNQIYSLSFSGAPTKFDVLSHVLTYSTGAIWVVVLALMTGEYLKDGTYLIPLFWPGVFSSIGIVFFALIGSLVYVAYRIYIRNDQTIEIPAGEKFKLRLRMCGRILVAPYIATVLVLLVGSVNPVSGAHEVDMFLAFITGCWIKPVINILNKLAEDFLNTRVKNFSTQTNRLPGSTDSVGTKKSIDARFLQEFRQAAKSTRGVIGMSVEKSINGPSPVVYIEPNADLEQLPESIQGHQVVIKSLDAEQKESYCDCRSLDLFWDKLTLESAVGFADRSPVAVEQYQDMILLICDDAKSKYFNQSLYSNAPSLSFNPLLACQDLLQQYADAKHYDFVAFFTDSNTLGIGTANYYVPLQNAAMGTAFPTEHLVDTNEFDFGNTLLGFQVFRQGELTQRTMLHEIGHAWCAYTPFKEAENSSEISHKLLDNTMKHWSPDFDCGKSCMEYDRKYWYLNNDGRYQYAFTGENDFEYCELDLYLMGLISPTEVRDLTLIKPRPNQFLGPNKPLQVNVENISFQQQVLPALGNRVGRTAKNIKQLWVVVSTNHSSAKQFADSLTTKKSHFTTMFSQATKSKATIDTSLK